MDIRPLRAKTYLNSGFFTFPLEILASSVNPETPIEIEKQSITFILASKNAYNFNNFSNRWRLHQCDCPLFFLKIRTEPSKYSKYGATVIKDQENLISRKPHP